MPGQLYVVATPLGNVEDLSPRALEVLGSVDVIACEDTRRTRRLLARYGLDTPTVSCHKFNESRKLDRLLGRLREGESLALVSDGGTPGVSDPGARLVRAALDAGIPVSPLPGPSAVAALISVSGLPGERFVFDGFLPHRAGERRRRLRELAGESRTVVLFEAPHRIHESLADIQTVLGDRPIVLGRELTKRHETLLRGTAAELARQLGPNVRGEISLALAGASAADRHAAEDRDRVCDCWQEALRESGGDRRSALRTAARVLGMKRAELYRYLAELGQVDAR